MARLRLYPALILLAALALGRAAPAAATEPPKAPTGLYDRPVLVFDPGMHTAPIKRADVDADGRFAVTGSDDRTVRIWSVADGRLLRTIRLPVGPGNVGKVYAVAISPDGALVAAGGWTGPTEAVNRSNIYLFDRETGALVKRIDGLPDVVYAPRLFAGRAPSCGDSGSEDVVSASTTATRTGPRSPATPTTATPATAPPSPAMAGWRRRASMVMSGSTIARSGGSPSERRPAGAGRSASPSVPTGRRLRSATHDTTAVDLFDGQTLDPLPGPDTDGIAIGNLMIVEWSTDGETLFAGGMYRSWGRCQPRGRMDNAGLGARRELPAGDNTIMTLRALADGGVLVAAGDPYLAVLDPEGGERWAHRSPLADFRNQDKSLAVSADGTVVDFGYEGWGKAPARFDLRSLGLTREPPHDGRTAPPDHGGIPEGIGRTPPVPC